MLQRDRRPPQTALTHSREGSALLVVLVVIVLLSLAAYSYSEKMVLEAEAAQFSARHAQARVSADSGIEYVAAILGGAEDLGEEVNLYHDPSVFAGIHGSTSQAKCSIAGPVRSSLS